MTEQEQEFLKELTALTHKYKVVVGACGCCNSPWIYEKEIKEGMEYTVDDQGQDLRFGED